MSLATTKARTASYNSELDYVFAQLYQEIKKNGSQKTTVSHEQICQKKAGQEQHPYIVACSKGNHLPFITEHGSADEPGPIPSLLFLQSDAIVAWVECCGAHCGNGVNYVSGQRGYRQNTTCQGRWSVVMCHSPGGGSVQRNMKFEVESRTNY